MPSQIDKTSSACMPSPRGFGSRGLRSCWTFLALVLGLFLVAGGAVSDTVFQAPYSGEKVSEYEVPLPVSPHGKHTFLIPSDCPAAHSAYRAGARQWGNRVERRVWDKVMQDCYYVAFLQRAGARPMHDFVSSYDFMNGSLLDIVPEAQCGDAQGEPCESLPPGMIELKQVLAPVSPEQDREANADDCCIEKGVFRGWVEYGEDGMRCIADRRVNGFRMLAIDFADVNADGYLDAIIRLIPMGRGVRRIPLILPLTRTTPDGPFSIPEHLVRF